jgi:hypothetical protein
MAKAKKPKKTAADNGASAGDLELKLERMEVLSMAQDLETVSTQMAALQNKIQALQSEANLANRNLQDLQAKGQEMHQQYQGRLAVLKEKLGVPEDKELNLRTGEFVDKPEQPEAAAPPQ